MWGTLPSAAIIQVLPLSRLLDLYDADQDVATLLRLHHFRNGSSKTSAVVNALKAGNVVLNSSTAKAMAHIAKLFGLDGNTTNLQHIQDFAARIVDGFFITAITSEAQSYGSIAATFARTLNSREHHRLDVEKAFITGTKQGAETMAYYSRRGRPQARRVRLL